MKGEISRKYSLEDIIREEIARSAKERVAPAASGGFDLNISSLSDITNLLKEINQLVQVMGKMSPQKVEPVIQRLPEGDNIRISKEPLQNLPPEQKAVPAFDYDAIVDNIISAFDSIITIVGDIPLSEAKKMIAENRDMVKESIRAAIEK